MTSVSSSLRPLAQCAVVVSPKDNVAVVKTGLAAGDAVTFLDGPHARDHRRGHAGPPLRDARDSEG
ncbi:MAG TPA: hypothetical protein VFD82_05395, partial [Planctomycetota bacterium]|nr:hypothetical protein [Planctomycetota bacterium]